MNTILTSDFSPEGDLTQNDLTSKVERIQIPYDSFEIYHEDSIKIINKDYEVGYLDHYLVINSYTPIIIKLYMLSSNDVQCEKRYGTHTLHIKSLVTSGFHKIVVSQKIILMRYNRGMNFRVMK